MRACTRRFGFVLATALCALGWSAESRAANWFELNFWLSGPRYDGVLPPCDYPATLGKITDRFGHKESKFWNSRLQIMSIDNIREVSYRPWASDTIPRRFCRATAHISDGHRRPVYYAIGEDLGMIGATWGVEWCVIGYDRNWAYNPACRAARP